MSHTSITILWLIFIFLLPFLHLFLHVPLSPFFVNFISLIITIPYDCMDTRFCDFLARCSFSTNFFKSSDSFDFPFWPSDMLENEVDEWRELCFFPLHAISYHFYLLVYEIVKEHVLSLDHGVSVLCISSLEFHSSSIEESNPLFWRPHQHDALFFRLRG